MVTCVDVTSPHSPVEQEEREDSREVGGGGVGRQVEHEQDEHTAGGRNQVVQLAEIETDRETDRDI